MKKFEYCAKTASWMSSRYLEWLQEMGQEGWQLVCLQEANRTTLVPTLDSGEEPRFFPSGLKDNPNDGTWAYFVLTFMREIDDSEI